MKTLLPLLVITFLLTISEAKAASYLIQLKNGSEFTTDQYWIEGNEIKFYISGGVTGISKERIKTIKTLQEVELPSQAKTGEVPTPPLTVDRQGAETVKPENKKAGGEAKEPSSEKIDIKYYKEKKSALKATFDEAWDRYIDATNNKDLEAKNLASEAMLEFSKQIYALADELKKKNQGVLPDWWEQP